MILCVFLELPIQAVLRLSRELPLSMMLLLKLLRCFSLVIRHADEIQPARIVFASLGTYNTMYAALIDHGAYSTRNLRQKAIGDAVCLVDCWAGFELAAGCGLVPGHLQYRIVNLHMATVNYGFMSKE